MLDSCDGCDPCDGSSSDSGSGSGSDSGRWSCLDAPNACSACDWPDRRRKGGKKPTHSQDGSPAVENRTTRGRRDPFGREGRDVLGSPQEHPGSSLFAVQEVPAGMPVRALRVWSLPRHAGLVAIRGYQRWISPRLRTCCRYEPSCSRYGADAVRAYGLLLGSRLALGRIRRCTRDVAHRTPDPLLLPHAAAR